ncbi:MAG: phenylalanine--tRNA ligase subunit alpha [Candidatus Methanomethylicota archaeon]|uniref:Phenylalanine--tRNA ligase alpha subunit n=1 Tax=Thermoproteota archaeon TaxID=2056631 RepID=A0A497ETQ1_9CREN|nr:MAG: phenylalanine--tRNA ligase subunit alpha [Candidatus Verstraetearchaeota archaeon]
MVLCCCGLGVSLELRESELKLLKTLIELGGKATITALAQKMGVHESATYTPLMLLIDKGLVSMRERTDRLLKCTDEGRKCAEKGLPEERLLKALKRLGGKSEVSIVLEEACIAEEEVDAALGWAKKRGLIKLSSVEGKRFIEIVKEVEEVEEGKILKDICAKGTVEEYEYRNLLNVVSILIDRGLLEVEERKEREVEVTSLGLEVAEKAKPTLTKLNADIIRKGIWRHYSLQPYDVKAKPPKLYPGKKHPYLEFLEELKEILLAMGFEEAMGPYVEYEFWNFDALFQAQNHPAREVHDSFFIAYPREGAIDADQDYIEKVKEEHERGWGYKWDLSIARRYVMRSQTTAVSIRFLAQHKKPPIKMFCLSKVFRPDVVDAKHSVEFHQLDGIVGDHVINFKHLLGILAAIAKELGFEAIKFVPSYFPFTEPSVEGFVKHPKLGWIECLGAGLFRPEVLRPLNIDFQVIAWGIGVDRLAMIKLGINDIRDLHTMRLDKLRGAFRG